jgi:lipoprotein-releasing system ATP-binding protein
MIEMKDIRKAYGSLEVLRGIDLNIEKGKLVGILGKSGTGKSTLLHILGTLDKPDSGTVVIGDQEPFKMDQRELARFRNENIGFVFQFHHLLSEFTSLENVMIPALLKKNRQEDGQSQSGGIIGVPRPCRPDEAQT